MSFQIPSLKIISLLFCVTIFSSTKIFAATKTWTGLGGDGNYANASNWSAGTLPTPADDVLLDNSFVATDYTVTLPNSSITIKSLVITPSANHVIKVILPSSNLLSPALTVTGGGYGIVINSGGIFQNSSGLTSGSSLNISDSIKINNGGKYIHGTRSMHASNIVQLLAKAAGTENGTFEFDVPGTQSYSISLSNRTYGNLIFSAAAAGGNRNYFATGSNTLTVNGDLQINAGITFNMQIGGTNGNIIVKRNFIQNGGTFNLSSDDGNSTVVKIAGDVTQVSSAILTETNSGTRAIELNGSAQQSVSMQGTISNNIIIRMNNAAGVILQSPLSLPYKLELTKGNITTSSSNLLTLLAGANISVDTAISNSSFINGPMRKEGLSSTDHFILPVGKANEFRWIELKKATGNFTVEYISANARNLSTSYDAGIDHISTHGYWSINADASPAASAKVELSFANASGSGVTDMATLRASQFLSGIWMNRNNTATTGTPGASGSVISEMINSFSSSSGYFVLASSVSDQNPLPVILTSFTAAKENDIIKLEWNVTSTDDIEYFEIWYSDNNNDFKKLDVIPSVYSQTSYGFSDTQTLNGERFYKLQVVEKNGNSFFSKIISVKNIASPFKILSIGPSAVIDNTTVFVFANERAQLQFIITGVDGKAVAKKYFLVERGENSISCNFSGLASGVYVLSCFDSKGNVAALKFVKL